MVPDPLDRDRTQSVLCTVVQPSCPEPLRFGFPRVAQYLSVTEVPRQRSGPRVKPQEFWVCEPPSSQRLDPESEPCLGMSSSGTPRETPRS